eukprot:IDg6817t1
MRCFSPTKSAPDMNIGSMIALGFEGCLSKQTPPVLTQSGIKRGHESRLPYLGIESFVTESVVRKIVMENSESYLLHVARVPKLTINDLVQSLSTRVLEEEEVVKLVKWWCRFSRKEIPSDRLRSYSQLVKSSVCFRIRNGTDSSKKKSVPLFTTNARKVYFHDLYSKAFLVTSLKIPAFSIANLESLLFLSKEFEKLRGRNQSEFAIWLRKNFSDKPCVPYIASSNEYSLHPTEMYLPSAELDFFTGVELQKVSPKVVEHGVTETFLKFIGVRETVSMDV